MVCFYIRYCIVPYLRENIINFIKRKTNLKNKENNIRMHLYTGNLTISIISIMYRSQYIVKNVLYMYTTYYSVSTKFRVQL